MSYKLFLDDLRTPPQDNWIIARDFEEFKRIILEKGVPSCISFDHDLGENDDGALKETGMDCAKWLVEQEIVLQDFVVHSANPVGAQNIFCLLENFKKFKEKYS